MDQAEASRRWNTAQELYHAAMDAFRQQHYRASVSLAYYACFQAMWVALRGYPETFSKVVKAGMPQVTT